MKLNTIIRGDALEILRTLPDASIVLDPFCGSGSTAEAAIVLGRMFIGIELDEQFSIMAERRISQSAGLLLAAGVG